MINIRLRIIILLCCLMTITAQAQSSKDAFIGVSKKELKKNYSQLAMMPLFVEPTLAMPDAYKKLILDEVLNKLKKSKFSLTPHQEYDAIQAQLSGLYASTVLASAQAAIDEHTTRELFFRHPVDGILSVEVIAVAAPFADDVAVWGGVKQKIKHRGDGFLGALTGRSYQGHVVASAIRVSITDRRGALVFRWLGGIELLMQRDGNKMEQLPPDKLWQKDKKVRQAIRYALKPI